MIEEIVLDYLKDNLEVLVVLEKPDKEPEEYVLIEKTGSSYENFINTATIVLQSYSTSLHKAAQLNEKVKAAMNKIIELNDISKSQLNSDYNYTDTTKKKYRYQAVYDLFY